MVALDSATLSDDDIVISGISGSFPGSLNVEIFQKNLHNGVNFVKKTSDPQWSTAQFEVPDELGMLDEIEKFDNSFFGIHRKQCSSLDPTMRLMMERTYEAIIDAGLNPIELRGTNTMASMGSVINEPENTWAYVLTKDGFGIVGHSRCMMANRISYFLGLHGPSFSLVSGDNCGTQALTYGYNSIKDGHVDAAIIGCSNLLFKPEMSEHFKLMGHLSKDGQSRPFSVDADGHGRGEGIVVVFLQRAKDAKRAYCSIVHSDQSFFGDRKTTFTTILADPIISFLEKFYQKCGVDPTQVGYVEAEASGYVPLEKVEVQVLEEVMLKGRRSPLLIGSVKGNTGHTEGASSFCSLIKLIIMMHTRKIPPTINHDTPHPDLLPIVSGSLKVVTETTQYNDDLLATNSFDIGGGFGHVLVRPFTKQKIFSKDHLPRVVLASSRTEEGITNLLGKLESMPFDAEYIGLIHNIYKKAFNHNFRGFTILNNGEEKAKEFQYYDGSRRPIWFVFSGMGSQWPGMAKHLMNLPLFADSIRTCHDILRPKGLDLIGLVTDDDPKIFDNILHSFVGIAAVQMALVDLLKALGIVPDGMIGHSVGELGCSYADGCFTPEQMIMAAYSRGKASLENELIRGSMAAIGLGADDLRGMLPADIDIACHNSNESCTISGPTEEIKKFVADLQAKNIFARAVNVSNIAYHSRYIEPVAPTLLKYLKEVIPHPKPRSAKWLSTSVRERDWDSRLARTSSAEYHTNNLLSAVLFEETSRHIPKNAITIEIAPHGLLQAILKRSLGKDCVNIPLTRRDHKDCVQFLFSAIGKMYMAGLVPQVSNLFPAVQFPVSRGTPYISPLISWDHQESWTIHPDFDKGVGEGAGTVTISLFQKEEEVYIGHKVNGHILMPTFALLRVIWRGFAKLLHRNYLNFPVVFENVRIHNQLELFETNTKTLHYFIQRGSGNFEILDGMKLIVTGLIISPETPPAEFLVQLPFPVENCFSLNREEVYKDLHYRGLEYSGEFQGIINAKLNDKGFSAKIHWTGDWVTFADAVLQMVILQCTEDSQSLQLPLAIQKIIIDPTVHSNLPEMDAVFDRSMGIARCGGLEIRGIRTYDPSLPRANEERFKLETIRFLPHFNPGLQDVETFVNMCIQLVVENNIDTIVKCNYSLNVVDLTNETSSNSVMRYVHRAVLNISELQVNMNVITSDENVHTDNAKLTDVLLAVSDLNTLQEGIQILDRNDGFVLVRMTENETLPSNHNLPVVAQQRFEKEHFVLMRKASESVEEVVRLSGNYTTWMTQLRDVLLNRDAKYDRKLFVVISCHQQQKGVHNFIREVNQDEVMKNIRCVFVLDKQVPRFSRTQSTYLEQLRANLKYNVFMDGAWGSFRKLPLEVANSADHRAFLFPSRFKGLKANYLGVNLKDLPIIENGKIWDPCNVGHLDFAGVTPDGQRVMGVAKNNRKALELMPEPHLTWQVPKSWSLEDAATVPFAYATAYYALVLKARTCSWETVLINAGCTDIGLASISVATALGCTVYTTVANTAQRIFLKKQYPQLIDNHIFSYEDQDFDVELRMATGCVGVHVILNSLPEGRLQASLRCLAEGGRFIHLGQADLFKNNNLGLRFFLENTTFYGVVADVLFNASAEWKKRLHAAVEEGIRTGTVRPLERKTFSKDDMDGVVSTLVATDNIGKVILTVSNEEVDGLGKYQFDPKSSYIIAGRELESCLNLVNWMIARRATRFVIGHGEATLSDFVNRRLKLISQLHHSVDITTVALGGIISSEVASSLVQQASNMAPLVGVFILPLSDDSNMSLLSLHHLDHETRKVPTMKQFVSVLCDPAWSVTEQRCNAGLAGLTVESQEDMEMRECLAALDRILLGGDRSVISISRHVADDENAEPGMDQLGPMLPITLDDLVDMEVQFSSLDGCTPVEIPSRAPRNVHVADVPPVFVVPGLQGPPTRVLEPLARNLMYPVFYTKLACLQSSLEASASLLAERVREVQEDGPYNLIGVSWGGALAIETARHLQALGQVTNVILVDGAPETLQGMARHLGVGDKMQVNLLARVLGITSQKELDVLLSLSDWKSRLDRALSLGNHNTQTSEKLHSALCVLKSNLQALSAYSPPSERLSGNIVFIKPNTSHPGDTCGLGRMFSEIVNVHSVPGDHRTILCSKETADIINDEVMAPL